MPVAQLDPQSQPSRRSSHIARISKRKGGSNSPRIARLLMDSVRGGADFKDFPELRDEQDSSSTERGSNSKIQFQVQTAAGFKDLDKKLDLTMDGQTTIAELKTLMQQNMPGKPPVTLQRLFHSGIKLKDDQTIGGIYQDSPLALPIVLDMAPPIEQLDYEALIQLRVRYNALDHKQLQFYAANAVGLKYAIQALDEHLMKKPSEDEVDENEEEDEEDEEDEEEEQRTRAMKDEIATLKDFLKKHEHEVPPSPVLVPEPSIIKGIIREVGIPGLQEWVETLALQLNLDWTRTSRYALGALIFGLFGAQGPWKGICLAMVPGVFLLQLRPFRYSAKVAWELMAVSPLVGGFSSALLSAPQQVLLTFDEKSYLEKLYGDEDMPPLIGPPVEGGSEEGEGGVVIEEERQAMTREEEEEEEEEEETSMTTQAGNLEEEEDEGEEYMDAEEGGNEDEEEGGDDDGEADEEGGGATDEEEEEEEDAEEGEQEEEEQGGDDEEEEGEDDDGGFGEDAEEEDDAEVGDDGDDDDDVGDEEEEEGEE